MRQELTAGFIDDHGVAEAHGVVAVAVHQYHKAVIPGKVIHAFLTKHEKAVQAPSLHLFQGVLFAPMEFFLGQMYGRGISPIFQCDLKVFYIMRKSAEKTVP